MRTRFSLLWASILFASVVLGHGCSPVPTQDALGWNGRGMPLPADNGAAGQGAGGSSSGGSDGLGAAGTAGDGTAGAGTAGRGTAGASAAGSGGATSNGGTSGAAGTSGVDGAGGSKAGAAGNAGTGGSTLPPTDAGIPTTGSPVSATCHLDVSVTTHSGGGNHQPKNVDAIWIQDGRGTFVKSLYVMARNEIQHLNLWNTATTAAGLSRNRVDAVTGATLPGYGTRTAAWNCTDVNQKLVAAGGYQVCFDLNDGNGSDKHVCDNITLGTTGTTSTPPDALPCFTARTLIYKP
ncbi:MAG: hypothetical protein JWM82_3857 [Myxococcales bacterium]|nr:hypothetical protein [Myxococcales bacterium]